MGDNAFLSVDEQKNEATLTVDDSSHGDTVLTIDDTSSNGSTTFLTIDTPSTRNLGYGDDIVSSSSNNTSTGSSSSNSSSNNYSNNNYSNNYNYNNNNNNNNNINNNNSNNYSSQSSSKNTYAPQISGFAQKLVNDFESMLQIIESGSFSRTDAKKFKDMYSDHADDEASYGFKYRNHIKNYRTRVDKALQIIDKKAEAEARNRMLISIAVIAVLVIISIILLRTGNTVFGTIVLACCVLACVLYWLFMVKNPKAHEIPKIIFMLLAAQCITFGLGIAAFFFTGVALGLGVALVVLYLYDLIKFRDYKEYFWIKLVMMFISTYITGLYFK